MLTTVIYRSHIHTSTPFEVLQEMVTAANAKNIDANVTGILLFNGTHFFQLLEGPEAGVQKIYDAIRQDDRHYNIVELLCDYAPARRFGRVGMELFDLREHDKNDVLQVVLEKGTSRYQLAYDDRALRFFRTFIESTEKENYFEIPPRGSWEFIIDAPAHPASDKLTSGEKIAFQPMVDPMARSVAAIEALTVDPCFAEDQGGDVYRLDLLNAKAAFAAAQAAGIGQQTLCINLLPMTLVMIPGTVEQLLMDIEVNRLVPEQVVIEFTESEIIPQMEAFTEAIRHLKSAGIKLAIDDFGAGFAGLQLLAQFQPERLKINRELIRDIHKSGPRQAIIMAIIRCCASLEIAVSATGIEQPEEWMWLEAAGISHFQGDLFAKPHVGGSFMVAWPERKAEL
ncbi:Blue light- and temperature-regulated antirepressor YcgF [Beauveria bassiana D1-5]|uniref:Blue light-and temperature-regulated antirepressor YcgF n=1 Tax=Beauveria bassiana D1-5 TaxID=1245745 RepID=A0A0A2W3R9_BEABA|nr:diguanylate phosphodiesterase [Klebsiella michiganensis]KGQ13085.1 Blue light- and temperature-regulated antirepressor YcgF [Beauveria bassiana D1-5]